MDKSRLALYGGPKAKTTPMGTGPRFGEEDLKYLKEAIDQNTHFYWYGNQVKQLTARFAELYGSPYCTATSSGTAAIHVALGICGVTAGDEVITSPVTDMGTIIGIVYQNAIPVFADLDPHSYTLDPKSVEAKITDKTKAIIAVHLTGGPTDMDAIMDIARRHNLKVIEDCAQSYMATYKGKLLGTIGDVGCFSLNDFKQISAGDGGLILTKTQEMYEAALRFADKNYQRLASHDTSRDVPFIAPNYRMNELTGAVGRAQVERLESVCRRRTEVGDRISAAIGKLPGIYPPKVQPDSVSTYWFYMFRVDEKEAGISRNDFSEALAAEGICNQRGYIPSCVYNYDLFVNRRGYQGTNCPFSCPLNGHNVTYYEGLCPTAEEILNTAIRFSIDEFTTDQDVEEIIAAITKISEAARA